MKEGELRKHCECSLCQKKIGESGLPIFWTVTINRYGLNADALRRQMGLGMIIGAPLASVMGPDEDLASPLGPPVKLTICERCAVDRAMPVAAMVMP